MVIVGGNEAESSTRKRRAGECSNPREIREEEEDEESSDSEGSDDSEEDEDMVKGSIASYYLHCSICHEPLRPSLLNCLNGHVGCAECWEKVANKCPVCNIVAVVRSVTLEKLIESFKIPCKNKQMGCEELIPYYMQKEHLENCPFGPSPCPVETCTHKVYQGELYDHFVNDHKFEQVNFPFNKPYKFHLDKSEDYVILLGPNKTLFILVTNPVQNKGCSISLHRINPLPEDDETDGFPLKLRAYTPAQKARQSESEKVELKTTVGYIHGGEFVGSSLLVPEYSSSGSRFEVSVLVQKPVKSEP